LRIPTAEENFCYKGSRNGNVAAGRMNQRIMTYFHISVTMNDGGFPNDWPEQGLDVHTYKPVSL